MIDCHMHAFPDFLAERTMKTLSQTSGMQPQTDGTYGDTLRKMKEWGVSHGVLLHIATRPGQQKKVNNWAAEIQNDHFIGFGSVHPDDPEAIEELHRIKALGLRGVKLHPDYQHFFVDEERVFPLYETIAMLGLPLVFHTGFDPYSPDEVHASPQKIARVADLFPDLTIICAHMGGYLMADEAEQYLVGKKVYLDTSMAATFLEPDRFERMCRKHGIDRILFGSDCPWSTPAAEQAFIEKCHFTSTEKAYIFEQNAKALLFGGV